MSLFYGLLHVDYFHLLRINPSQVQPYIEACLEVLRFSVNVLLIGNLFTDEIANIYKVGILGMYVKASMAVILTPLPFICIGMHGMRIILE